MKHILHNILIASIALSLSCAPVLAYAMPDPAPASQVDKKKAAEQKKKEAEKKKKEAEKKKKEAEKAKAAKEKAKAAAAKQKEADKKKAEAAKANEKKQAQRDKDAAERAKIAAEKQKAAEQKAAEQKARDEKALRDYEKYQASLENPKPEVISYINLGIRAGYAAMMDKLDPMANGSLWGAGTLNQSNALQQLKGGPGAGLNLTYNLEYQHFLFETGLDFRFLRSTSDYGFQAVRKDMTYGSTYTYLFDDLNETRNMMQVGVPIMFGAQFNRFYFLLGAKVGYSLMGSYTQSGLYDITVNDPAFLEPYGMGIKQISGATNTPITFKQPEVSLAAELGIDLDEWLQQAPKPVDKKDKKNQKKVAPGQRLPFGREHVHYRVGLFAEYGVLNTNGTAAALPVEFAPSQVDIQKTNTMLAMNGTKLNNLFVGAKFTIQFEIPGKTPRPVPAPPSYASFRIVDSRTNEPIKNATIETRNTQNGKVVVRQKPITPKGLVLKHALGTYESEINAEGYYPVKQIFAIEQVGDTQHIIIPLQPCPVLRVRVYNQETGMPVPTNVLILKDADTEPAYTLTTDDSNKAVSQMLAEGPTYRIHIAQMGYDTVNMPVANIGDSLNIALVPIKKGEVFIIKNLHFATNKTRILPTSEEALNDLYKYLSSNPQIRIKIIGHTDNVGKDAANQKLSEGRATAVKQDLMERGITAERIEAEGRGESQPIDTNDTEEGRQNNRRVEIEIL